MIRCEKLTHRFGDFEAVRGLNLEIGKGEICALLGPNGAGKSTTMKLLAGLLKPTSGVVTVSGSIGVLPENLGLFDDLTVEEHLQMTADLHRVQARSRIAQLLKVLQLETAKDRYASQCSHGTRKKTAFAMAVLHNPQILFLDEPFEAVDLVTAKLMFDLLQKAALRGVTVLLTSHILTLVEHLATHYVLIKNGAVLLSCPAAEMTQPLQEIYFGRVEKPITEDLEWLGESV